MEEFSFEPNFDFPLLMYQLFFIIKKIVKQSVFTFAFKRAFEAGILRISFKGALKAIGSLGVWQRNFKNFRFLLITHFRLFHYFQKIPLK